MSAVDVTNIAGEYCSLIIELNLNLTIMLSKNTLLNYRMINGDVVSYDSSSIIAEQYKAKRISILNNIRNNLRNKNVNLDHLNDEQLNNYLFKIYSDKLDNDKYGINKRS